MNLAFLDPYRERDSFVHRLDARVKLVVCLFFIVTINLSPIQAWPAYVLYLALIVSIIAASRLSVGSVVRRSMLAAPFVLIAAVGMPFVAEGRGILTIPLLSWRLTVTDVGMLRFANVIVKSWLSVLVAVALIFTTHFLELARAMRSLGVPAILTSIILLMYRYLYVLVDEALRMIRAREARSAAAEDGHEGGGLLWRLKVSGNMVGTLFLRTYERSERSYHAMLARGFTDEIHTLAQQILDPRHVTLGGLGVALLTAVVAVANLCW